MVSNHHLKIAKNISTCLQKVQEITTNLHEKSIRHNFWQSCMYVLSLTNDLEKCRKNYGLSLTADPPVIVTLYAFSGVRSVANAHLIRLKCHVRPSPFLAL